MNTQKLKGLIKMNGYTYHQFCEKCGFGLTTLTNCLKKGRTDTDTLLKMCQVLNVEPQTLLK